MATYRKLKSGKWQAQIRKVGHKPIVDSFPTKAMAERWARQVETELASGTFRDMRKAESALISKLLGKYAEEVVELRKSKRGPKAIAVELAGRWPHESIAAIDADAVIELMRDIKKRGLTRDTADKYLNVIAGTFTAAAALWSLPVTNPVPEVKRRLRLLSLFAAPRRRDRRVTDDELRALQDWEPQKKTNIKAITFFVIETALRRGEVAALNWSDIDKRGRVAVVRESKTDHKTGLSGRRVPLSERAIAILDKLPRHISGSVFGVEPDSISQAFGRMCEQLGIEDLRFHDLRHEATSRFFEMGLSIEEVAAITGHTDWSSLKRYTHPKAERIAAKLSQS